ncbi:hypothetical protein ABTX62_07490 [Streptomyces sp. NPDC096046]|uniref:hypothetical protein n=1 Tax=Streptomyces sp. NPDC096046 TaxID=3155542 RepID=UPI0033266DE6
MRTGRVVAAAPAHAGLEALAFAVGRRPLDGIAGPATKDAFRDCNGRNLCA